MKKTTALYQIKWQLTTYVLIGVVLTPNIYGVFQRLKIAVATNTQHMKYIAENVGQLKNYIHLEGVFASIVVGNISVNIYGNTEKHTQEKIMVQ